jgi:hypothetical protein
VYATFGILFIEHLHQHYYLALLLVPDNRWEAHFQEHPQRAGKNIWGKEREPATFSDSSNCKDPRYR